MSQVRTVARVIFPGLLFLFAASIAQAGPVAPPATGKFQCVLPYISGGAMVQMLNPSGDDLTVEIKVMNAYWYDIVLPKNSSYSFQSPEYQYFFAPIIHGGPISFKSDQPIVVYTVLKDDSVTLQCSDTTKRAKIFVGGPKTGLAVVNSTKLTIGVQIFQDADKTPIYSFNIGPEERRMGFLNEAFPVSGTHTYTVVADNDGIGIATISYDLSPAVAIPIAESTTAIAAPASVPPSASFGNAR